MKTKMNISNLKKLAVTICATLLITTGSYTQPNTEGFGKEKMISLASLEVIMSLTEQSIRYAAPAIQETEDVSVEMERLEMLAGMTEASLKYKAPAVDEAEEIAPELARLEMLAVATEASLKYKAPAADDFTGTEIGTGNSAEIMLADKTSTKMK